MKTKLFVIIALILIILALFINFYPLLKSEVVSPYETENIITTHSTFITYTLSTSKTSHTTTIEDEYQYTEDDFKTSYYAQPLGGEGPHRWTNVLQLQNLEETNKVLITLDTHHGSPYDSLTLKKRAEIIEKLPVYYGLNTYEFYIARPGDYSIVYTVFGPGEEPRFTVNVIITQFHSKEVTETIIATSRIQHISTHFSTETLTIYSTTLIAVPLENGRFIAYALWILAAALIVASIVTKRKILPAKENRKPISKAKKYCIFCGAEIPRIAEYCGKCGKKVK